MELSPQAVAAATFKTVKRGYDPDEVRAYLIEVSASLEASHQQATAMEARARAAIAKLQDATQHPQSTGPVPVVASTDISSSETEVISRTLLLAQRTADMAVAEAQAEATTIKDAAQAEATTIKDAAQAEAATLTASARTEARTATEKANTEANAALSHARAEAARLLDEARAEAQRAKTEQHLRTEVEVKELQSRRQGLIADIDTLEKYATQHRERLRETSSALAELAERVNADSDRPSLRTPISSSSSTADDAVGHYVPPPPITGQVPVTGQVLVQPGIEPLVSPRPTSADEVRSMWQEAERADEAGLSSDDPTPVEGISFDAPTPTDGIRR